MSTAIRFFVRSQVACKALFSGNFARQEQRRIRSPILGGRTRALVDFLARGRRWRVMEGVNSEIPEQDRHRDAREDKASDEHHERVLGIVGTLYSFFLFGRAVSYRIWTDHHEVSWS